MRKRAPVHLWEWLVTLLLGAIVIFLNVGSPSSFAESLLLVLSLILVLVVCVSRVRTILSYRRMDGMGED